MTDEHPPQITAATTTMTTDDTTAAVRYLTIRLEQTLTETDAVRWTATEHGSDHEGTGRSPQRALAAYAAACGDFKAPTRNPPRQPNAQVLDPEEGTDE